MTHDDPDDHPTNCENKPDKPIIKNKPIINKNQTIKKSRKKTIGKKLCYTTVFLLFMPLAGCSMIEKASDMAGIGIHYASANQARQEIFDALHMFFRTTGTVPTWIMFEFAASGGTHGPFYPTIGGNIKMVGRSSHDIITILQHHGWTTPDDYFSHYPVLRKGRIILEPPQDPGTGLNAECVNMHSDTYVKEKMDEKISPYPGFDGEEVIETGPQDVTKLFLP